MASEAASPWPSRPVATPVRSGERLDLVSQPATVLDHPGPAPGLDDGVVPGRPTLSVSASVAYQEGA